jgi:hypothetical protein
MSSGFESRIISFISVCRLWSVNWGKIKHVDPKLRLLLRGMLEMNVRGVVEESIYYRKDSVIIDSWTCVSLNKNRGQLLQDLSE